MDPPSKPVAASTCDKLASGLSLATAVSFALSPLLAPGFGGFQPNQFPVPQSNPPVQPAGAFFSIWGIIYTWLVASGAYSLFARPGDSDWAPSRWPLVVSLAVGTSWLPVAKRSPVWATVVMVVMLAAGLKAMFSAGKNDRWIQRAPMGLYCGWLTAAMGLSVGLLLAGWGYTNQTNAALVAIAGAGVGALVASNQRKDTPSYLLGVVWGLTGIAVTNIIRPNTAVLVASAVGALALGARAVQLFVRASGDNQ